MIKFGFSIWSCYGLRCVVRKPAVAMIAGVDGGGKTTSLGKLAYRLKKSGEKILMAAGDTFRAATSDQLEMWTEGSGCLHTNYSLMDELKACKKAAGKIVRGAPDNGLAKYSSDCLFIYIVYVLNVFVGIIMPVASVDDELGIPVKFVGVGEGVEDLQPFDAEAFVNAIFSTRRSRRR
ncbi:hypothetical protein BDE02_02G143300 [Populus trichocarpa]|nr:hypothetical protein BDE02_02G143300 [Populus trichocarpa]